MSYFNDSSSETSSEEEYCIQSKPLTYDISILKHLPEARKILQGQNYEQQITKCIYEHPLSKNPAIVIPKSIQSSDCKNQALQHNRLTKLQEVMFDHVNMKDKIKGLLGVAGINGNKQFEGSLWTLYSTQTPSYARFGLTIRKTNFANVMMPINGVNIILGNRPGCDKIPKITNPPPLPPSDNQALFSLGNGANFNLKPLNNEKCIKPPDSIRFDSHFECGNLLYAYRQPEQSQQNNPIQTYDLILQNDINTKGHTQWFYFKVYNTKSHNRIKFNIVNFTKDQSMFSYGIKPLIFSEKDYNKHRVGWVRNGQKINYATNRIKKQNGKKTYYTLSFQYYFKEADTVYFAPSHPYTHSQLLTYFDDIMLNKSLSNIVALKTVSQTVGRNIVNVLTIGSGKKALKQCKIVWIFGRQHPGQITASYMAEGIIQYLLKLYTCPPKEWEYVLNNTVFKIVPMINVDGVIHGNTRAQLTGVDPNRMWKKPLKRLTPVISGLKKLIAANKESVQLVLDLHSHSKKLGCFFYGNSFMHDPKSTKIYPTLVCQGDQRFELKNCRFRGGYETTARNVLFQELSIPFIYTVECSLLGYMKNKRIMEFNLRDYHEMGKKLMETFMMLQKEKTLKKQQQIIEQLQDKIPQRDDVDSARSESSLSDDEYEQIRMKNKKKAHKIKKIRNCIHENHEQKHDNPLKNNQNTMKKIEQTKYYIKKNGRPDTKIGSLKENKNATKLSASDLPNIVKAGKNCSTKDINPLLKDNLNKHQNNSSLKKGHNLNNIYLNKTIQPQKNHQIKTERGRLKTGCEISSFNLQTREIQIQVTLQQNNTMYHKKKKDSGKSQMLCIVGSSLQDEFVCAYKNDVSIQVYSEAIKQSISGNVNNVIKNTDVNKKSLKNTKKTPKLLNYLCSNLIGVPKQNAVLPQNDKKSLAPIARRKITNII